MAQTDYHAGLPLAGFARRRVHWPRARLVFFHFFLFGLTFLTTTAFGSAAVDSFRQRRALDVNDLLLSYSRLYHWDAALWNGLTFSVPLLLILLAHELGHYWACRLWRVEASLPYFLPSPTMPGTFGAFIKIQSPIYTRQILFDIGISGPLAGFVVLLPILCVGVWQSRFASTAAWQNGYIFGTPLLLWMAEKLHFGSAGGSLILLHPLAMAAWAGLLATAINLLPMGQLDGGHILYSAFGERGHRTLATVSIAGLVLLGFFYWPWWAWAIVMFFFGRRHPLVYDSTPLSRGRLLLSTVALLVLVLSMAVVPVTTQ